MATIGNQNPTLSDVIKRLDPDGQIAAIAEILNETNEINVDMTWVEGNLPTGHESTIRTGLPTPTWRLYNQGVAPTKSRTAQVVDTVGMLEARSHIDEKLLKRNNNSSDWLMSENVPFIEGMNQEFTDTLIYGNTETDPEQFLGLSPRYDDLSAESGDNILDAGGTGSDNTSVWMVVWSPNTIHGIYPKGSQAGLQFQNLGVDDVDDGDGNPFRAHKSLYQWEPGLTVRDWRFGVRIANIDVSDLSNDASTGADLIDLMVQAIELVPNMNMGRPSFYANRNVLSFLRRQITNKNNVELSMDEVGGKRVVNFSGIPVRKVNAILETEAQIT